MPSTVRLVNAVFYAHHGVMPEEHRLGRRFEVDVAIDVDVTAAALADDLTLTVDYERVYAIARHVVTEQKVYLIERLAHRIAADVLDAFPHATAAEVTVRKPDPPVGGTVARAEVAVRLGREGIGPTPSARPPPAR